MKRAKGGWRKAVRILLRLLVGLFVVLLVALAALAWWAKDHGKPWLDRTVRERITEAVDRASVDGYRFTITGSETDALQGDLVVTGVTLSYDSALVDRLRDGRLDYLFAAQAARLELRGFSYWRLLLLREFKAEALEVLAPRLFYVIGGKRVDLKDPFERIEGGGARISVLSVDTLLVRDASCSVQDLGDRLPLLDLSGLDITTTDARLAVSKRRDRVWVSMDDALFDLDSLGTALPDGSHVSTGAVHLERKTRTGSIHRLRWDPSPHDLDSTATDRMRRTVLGLQVEALTFTGLDVDALIADQMLKVRHVHVKGSQLNASLDKALPEGPAVPRSLPPAALLDLRFVVHVDTLTVHDADICYAERNALTGRWGRLPIMALEARFVHLVNDLEDDPRVVRKPLAGTFSGFLFDSAAFTGTYAAELDPSQRFTLDLQVHELPCVVLNQATRPLMRLVVEEGILHRLELQMAGDDRQAKGMVAMRVSDLRVRVEPGTPTRERHSMFGALLETMLAEEYGGGLDMDGRRSFQVERDPDRGVFTYLWQALREGLSRNLLPEAKGRVKAMFRQDKARSRMAREQRKARREDRK
jgi:hypothetical protein